MLIIAVRYICTETGYERCSQNVKYETVIDEDLHSTDSYEFQGTIIAKTYASVKCICGQTHRYLLTSEHEAIRNLTRQTNILGHTVSGRYGS